MGNPTVYKRPTKSLPGREPSERAKEKWKKHRDKKNLDSTVPKQKTR